jgi:hypothetical protein
VNDSKANRRRKKKKNPPRKAAGLERIDELVRRNRGSLLPRAFLVAVRLQALSALVLVHLQTTFLFQVAHGDVIFPKAQRASGLSGCKADSTPRGRSPASANA